MLADRKQSDRLHHVGGRAKVKTESTLGKEGGAMPTAGRFSRRCATTTRMRAPVGLALGLLLLAGSTAASGVGPFPWGVATFWALNNERGSW